MYCLHYIQPFLCLSMPQLNLLAPLETVMLCQFIIQVGKCIKERNLYSHADISLFKHFRNILPLRDTNRAVELKCKCL